MKTQRQLRCAFAWVEASYDRVVLRDLDVPGKMSLTNDAEGVVDLLLAAEALIPGTTRLFYFDSDDEFAEIEYDSTGFLRFAHAVRP